jgi:asparagine synthase (glutamine-hydrolysing)
LKFTSFANKDIITVCGIAGIILKSNEPNIDLAPKLRAMAQAMAHRGPDDEGIFVSPNGQVGLANRRLSIRDLSPSGHMPMMNDLQDVIITYNGEIYNADTLRLELEREGYAFHSHTDTEVILRGYEHWGNEVVQRLRGMFAFAVCDFRYGCIDKPKILIARDHMGIKPIYYWKSSNAIVFASELKSLLASGMMPKQVNPAGLVGYLLMGSVPNPFTIYKDIRSLEPSTYLEIDTANILRMDPTIFWSLPVDIQDVSNLNEAVENVRFLLTEAVRIRLVSDVPLGAFLSGGLDSSSVVALMRQATNGIIRTCSIAFDESAYSESVYAQAVAKHVDAEHFERIVTLDDVKHEFDNILHASDQPTIDGVNTYFVSQTARQAGLTVALSGLGGDELFGGYPNTFKGIPRFYNKLALLQRIPLGTVAAQIALGLRSHSPRLTHNQDALVRPASLASSYVTLRGLFSYRQVRKLVSRDIWESASQTLDAVRLVNTHAGGVTNQHTDEFAWVSRALLRTFMHDQLLRDTDVMSMKHSLEVRVPFVDRELVSSILRLPTSMKKMNGQTPKPLLALAMQGLLPDEVLNRRDKQGFVFPFDLWLRGGLANKARQAIDLVIDNKLISGDAANHVIEQFNQGNIEWSRLWSLVTLAGTV